MNNPFQELAERLTSIESILVDLQKSAIQTPSSQEAELLNVSQAAKFLRLTTQTVYDKIHTGTLPCVKQGNRIYFFKDELILWLKSGRQKTAGELADQARELVAASCATRRRKGGTTNP